MKTPLAPPGHVRSHASEHVSRSAAADERGSPTIAASSLRALLRAAAIAKETGAALLAACAYRARVAPGRAPLGDEADSVPR